jgi:O-Antigen ligase
VSAAPTTAEAVSGGPDGDRRSSAARDALLGSAAIVLLAGPTALAFARGGYFAVERLWAALGAVVLVAVAALFARRPLPRSTPGRVAVGGLAGLLGWVLLSRTWAPLAGPAIEDAQRLTLYLAALVAAAALLRGRWARAAEPALATGVLAVIAYGLSERVLPDVFDLTGSRTAMGRLEQPLTYWNAMGVLAAMGIVLCARLAGDPARARDGRALAAAAAAPLGAGLALSFSRGGIVAAAVGLAVLLAMAPGRVQLRAAVVVAATAALAGVLAALLPATHQVTGPLGNRESQGVVLLGGIGLLAIAAALAARRIAAAAEHLRGLRPAAVVAGLVVAIALVAGAAAVEGDPERAGAGATPARLGSADSNRYSYWRVALEGFANAPLHGGGAGSFGPLWLRERTIPEVVRDAHSLELETAAELGLVGLLLLGALFGGIVACAARARRRAPALVAGPAAALAVWAAHSALDWDWELPAGATLSAILLAGVVIALAEPDALDRSR